MRIDMRQRDEQRRPGPHFPHARTYGLAGQAGGGLSLRQVYDLAKMGPTSANMRLMRVFVKSREAKRS